MAALVALQVLAEPRRLAIVDLLREGERAVGELVDRLGVSQPAVSKHLRVLKDAGLVDVRADAQRRLYRIRPEPLAELDALEALDVVDWWYFDHNSFPVTVEFVVESFPDQVSLQVDRDPQAADAEVARALAEGVEAALAHQSLR